MHPPEACPRFIGDRPTIDNGPPRVVGARCQWWVRNNVHLRPEPADLLGQGPLWG
jgi:hypothetical protein